MQNNYHDLVDRNDIADSVTYWNGKGKKNFPNHEFVGKTVDEAIAYWEAQAKKTDSIEHTLWTCAENADMMSDSAAIEIVNELLSHPDRDRLRMIHDGSYYTHRIWFHVDNDGKIVITPSICWMNSEFKRMSNQLIEKSPREQVDFLFKNFEVVYIQTPAMSSRSDVEDWCRREKWDREFDFVGWDDMI